MRRFAFTSVVFAVFLLAGPSAFAQVGGGAPAPPEEESADERAADRESVEEESAETAPEASDEREAAQGESPDAEQGGQATAAGSMQESKASQERTIPGGTLAVISYILLWLMTMAFIGVTARRQSQLGDELEALERRMDRVVGDFEDEV